MINGYHGGLLFHPLQLHDIARRQCVSKHMSHRSAWPPADNVTIYRKRGTYDVDNVFLFSSFDLTAGYCRRRGGRRRAQRRARVVTAVDERHAAPPLRTTDAHSAGSAVVVAGTVLRYGITPW